MDREYEHIVHRIKIMGNQLRILLDSNENTDKEFRKALVNDSKKIEENIINDLDNLINKLKNK